MSWWHKELGHQQPWYWLCWTRLIRSPRVKGLKSSNLWYKAILRVTEYVYWAWIVLSGICEGNRMVTIDGRWLFFFSYMLDLQTHSKFIRTAVIYSVKIVSKPDLHIGAETKWRPFRRRHYKTHFLNENSWMKGLPNNSGIAGASTLYSSTLWY